MNNIYLIGMPGCGKSFLAKKVAKRLDLTYHDLDRAVEKTAKRSIVDIFSDPQAGEEHFRQLETQELKKTLEQKGLIVATGGGAVIKAENVRLMKKGGLIVFINRPPRLILQTLKTNKRPLLQHDTRNRLLKMFEKRYPLYKKACDLEFISKGRRDQAVNSLTELLQSKLDLDPSKPAQ
ncbi:MAG: shikimate kinase [Bacillota bacterium]|jgi:shikimate kinase